MFSMSTGTANISRRLILFLSLKRIRFGLLYQRKIESFTFLFPCPIKVLGRLRSLRQLEKAYLRIGHWRLESFRTDRRELAYWIFGIRIIMAANQPPGISGDLRASS